MIDKNKNSKKSLTQAVACLRCQEGIVVKQESGKLVALYPTELLSAKEQEKYKLTKSKTFIKLAKMAGILPSLSVISQSKITANWQAFLEKDLQEALEETGSKVFETTRAKLPLEGAEDSILVSFREEGTEAVHLALIIGKKKLGQTPLVRVHSSCVTGDILGSLRCDCGGQLQLALAKIKAYGYGVLLYLNQEGRGIGITNKIRSYKLQEQGLDTYEANHELGFVDDERDFYTASAILKSLKITEINLLSNNPHKIAELKKHGITIKKRVPIVAKSGKHNHKYITAKAKKAGHIF